MVWKLIAALASGIVLCVLLRALWVGWTVAGSGPSGNQDLLSPVILGDVATVRRLVEGGADVNAADSHRSTTPLAQAANAGNEEIVDILLSHGADVNKQYPLFNAADQNCLSIARELLNRGADPNGHRFHGTPTALLHAARKGHTEMVRLLVERGVDISSPQADSSPLLEAASGGHSEVVEFLLSRRVDVDIRDLEGQTSLYVAATRGDVKTAGVLLRYGADATIRTNTGDTPLQAAERNGHRAMVTLLKGDSIAQ